MQMISDSFSVKRLRIGGAALAALRQQLARREGGSGSRRPFHPATRDCCRRAPAPPSRSAAVAVKSSLSLPTFGQIITPLPLQVSPLLAGVGRADPSLLQDSAAVPLCIVQAGLAGLAAWAQLQATYLCGGVLFSTLPPVPPRPFWFLARGPQGRPCQALGKASISLATAPPPEHAPGRGRHGRGLAEAPPRTDY